MDCMNCGKIKEGKGKYCSDKCKQAAYRNRIEAPTVTDKAELTVTAVTNVTVPAVTQSTVTGTVTPEGLKPEVPANYGRPDCECLHCQNNRRRDHYKLNHGAYKPASQLAPNEINRVSLPGDVDYDGVCLQDKYKGKLCSIAVKLPSSTLAGR